MLAYKHYQSAHGNNHGCPSAAASKGDQVASKWKVDMSVGICITQQGYGMLTHVKEQRKT